MRKGHILFLHINFYIVSYVHWFELILCNLCSLLIISPVIVISSLVICKALFIYQVLILWLVIRVCFCIVFKVINGVQTVFSFFMQSNFFLLFFMSGKPFPTSNLYNCCPIYFSSTYLIFFFFNFNL